MQTHPLLSYVNSFVVLYSWYIGDVVIIFRYGTLCIRENPGCLFIATNRDAVGHMTDLQEWPGHLAQ